MKVNQATHSVGMMCRLLGISRSGFYAWMDRPMCARQRRDLELTGKICAIHRRSRDTYGAPSIHAELADDHGIRVGRKRVARLMRQNGLRGATLRKYVVTTQSDSQAAKPIDLVTATLACDALRMALFRRKRPHGVIMHTDRGSQYCSREHRALLDQNGLVASMSAKGNCYDNAAMESWNHSLKVEAIHGERFATRAKAREQVFDYIEVDYNRERLHSTLGYVSPEQFEQANAA